MSRPYTPIKRLADSEAYDVSEKRKAKSQKPNNDNFVCDHRSGEKLNQIVDLRRGIKLRGLLKASAEISSP